MSQFPLRDIESVPLVRVLFGKFVDTAQENYSLVWAFIFLLAILWYFGVASRIRMNLLEMYYYLPDYGAKIFVYYLSLQNLKN